MTERLAIWQSADVLSTTVHSLEVGVPDFKFHLIRMISESICQKGKRVFIQRVGASYTGPTTSFTQLPSLVSCPCMLLPHRVLHDEGLSPCPISNASSIYRAVVVGDQPWTRLEGPSRLTLTLTTRTNVLVNECARLRRVCVKGNGCVER